MVAAGAQFWPRNLHFFNATTIKPPVFGVRWIQLNGIISPLYPKVTLDAFGFPVDAHLAG